MRHWPLLNVRSLSRSPRFSPLPPPSRTSSSVFSPPGHSPSAYAVCYLPLPTSFAPLPTLPPSLSSACLPVLLLPFRTRTPTQPRSKLSALFDPYQLAWLGKIFASFIFTLKRLDYLVMYINKRNRIYEINAILYKTFIFLIFNAFIIIFALYCLHYLELFQFVSKCFITYQKNYW